MAAGALSRSGGFAVILTLVLITFLVGLLTVLATLSTVEGRISSQGIKQATARQNALMALRIGLGQLQKFAGPDTRVTATAEASEPALGNHGFTGVWDTEGNGPGPLTWLVSGNERDPRVITPASAFSAVEMIGLGSSDRANDVVAPLQPIMTSPGAGAADTAPAGHYAWWVGDEGVKASVVLAGNADDSTDPPNDSAELRGRRRQQGPQPPGPADALGQPVFEPRDSANAPLIPKIIAFSQLGFLKAPGGSDPMGRDIVRPYFSAWTTRHRAVLANPKQGGLKQDLSLKPELLGGAYAAWVNCAGYMEDSTAPLSPLPAPAYPPGNPVDSMRRRYRLTAPQAMAGITHGVAPVLSYFLLTFNVRTDPSVSGSVRPVEARARWLAALWNPYTSGLVPENLELEVENLPAVQVVNDSDGTTSPAISLDALYGAPLRIALPWESTGRADQQTWLPGRVYCWASKEDLGKTSPVPSAGFASAFYTRTLSTAAGQGVQRTVPGVTMTNSALGHLQGNQAQLKVNLFHASAGGGRELLGTFSGPTFGAFTTTPAAISAATYQISFVFHLAESADTPAMPEAWLTSAGQDPREASLPAGAFVPAANGPRPELYPNYTAISFPDRLLDRALPASAASATGQSYNEDTPLFELPRQPVLSLGALQHVPTAGTRPFAIGNSWGQSGGWNAVFDRYFLSGLTPATTTLPLPNPFLRTVGRAVDSSIATTLADLQAEAATGFSSKHLWQEGAFNVNSTHPAAWLAVLRSGRFPADTDFTYVDVAPASGTAGDQSPGSVPLAGVPFFRFPFSAQETYRADPGYAASTTTPPAAPNQASPANTHLFRRGVRVLSAEQLAALADAICGRVRQRQSAAGPFRSLEEFLGPSALFDGGSLLEHALAAAATSDGRLINDPSVVAEFSSQWLTQGDLLTALAPLLVVRSDTFRIRAYGDVANPVTGQIEARAWAEASVQRMPTYVDDSQPASTARGSLNPVNQAFGRRFRIISFQWLDHSAI